MKVLIFQDLEALIDREAKVFSRSLSEISVISKKGKGNAKYRN
jgi:hypothetical protein